MKVRQKKPIKEQWRLILWAAGDNIQMMNGTYARMMLVALAALCVAEVQPTSAQPFIEITIYPNGDVDPPTAPIKRQGSNIYELIGDVVGSIVVLGKNDTVVDGACYTLQGMAKGSGVKLDNANNVTIKSMNITMFEEGIALYNCSEATIFGNNITNTNCGIFLHDSSSNNNISANLITNNQEGIWITSALSINNTISNNHIASNDAHGLVTFSNLTTICNNAITKSHRGVSLIVSSNNTLCGNEITSNSYGISIWGPSENNRICHNNIFDNTVAVYSMLSTSTWDDSYPSGGNYWGANYTGPDSNSDGIGDTPYVVDENNIDRYPLMAPHVIPESPSFSLLLFMLGTLSAFLSMRQLEGQHLHKAFFSRSPGRR